jgi:hypothetical protein
MGKKSLLLSSLALLAVSWAVAPPRAEAMSCANVSDVTLLSAAGCDFGGLTFSNFSVSASAGFTAATVGVGPSSIATPTNVNLIYQLSSTPGVGPGDVLFSHGVTASPGIRLTGIDLTNDATTGVVIGEVACRVMFSPTGTCAPADRLAMLVATTGQTMNASFASPVDFAFLHKDIDIGVGGFISDFSNSHDIAPTPEPATLLLLGSTLTGMGLAWRRRGGRLA